MPFDDTGPQKGGGQSARNVRGGPLSTCSVAPMTGYTRSGGCEFSPRDTGSHTVCAVVDAAFLAHSRASGNDLSTPRPEYGFAGLRPGDRWCLCAPRWQQALRAGVAPPVVLAASHERALDHCSLADLEAHAYERDR